MTSSWVSPASEPIVIPPLNPTQRHRRTVGQAWLLTIVAGALCGPFAFGLWSLLFFPVAAVVGAMVGIVLGLPIGFVLADEYAAKASPPRDPGRFVASQQRVGMAIALVINGPTNVVALVGSLTGDRPLAGIGGWALFLGFALFCLAMSAFAGRLAGRDLAVSHLQRLGLAPSSGRSAFRRWR